MPNQEYSPKDPAETFVLGWDFAPIPLAVGETILSATWVIQDPEDPTVDNSNMLIAGPSIVGSVVRQAVTAGISGQAYVHRITISTSLGNVFVEKPTQLVAL